MKNFSNVILAGSLFLFAHFSTNAQQYALKESTADLKGPQHEVLRCSDGDIITITYPFADDKDPVIVSRFDRNLNEKYSSTLPDLSKQHYQGSLYADGNLFLFCSDKNGAVSRYEVNDKTGALTGSATGLFNLTGKEEDAQFFSGSAPAGGFHYVMAQVHEKKEKGMVLEGVILDKQCNKTGSFTFTTPEDHDDFGHLDIVQTDKGDLFLIYNVYVKTSKDNYTPYVYTIATVDPTGKTGSFALTGVPPGDLRNMSWTMQDNRLVFTGFLAPAKKGGFRTICTGTIDPLQKKIDHLQTTDIGPLMTRVPDHYRGWMSEDASLIKTLPLPDGSRVLVLEIQEGVSHDSHYVALPGSSNAQLANGTMTSYSITYLYRNELYLLKLDRTNTPQWLNVIPKRQVEADVVLSIGTAAETDTKGDIQLFFLDNKKNSEPAANKVPEGMDGLEYKKNVLACVTVSADGTMKKQFLDAPQDPEFRPMLGQAVDGKDNDISFLAIKVKKAFKVEALLNHSHFHFGTITAK